VANDRSPSAEDMREALAVYDGVVLDHLPLPSHQPIDGACRIASTSSLV
jgi:hypothetical protein